MLSELLSEKRIQIVDEVMNWEQAIDLVSQPLIESGDIEPEYVKAIISSTTELGPYYVLAPMIAMPHARPEQGVRNNGLSLLIIKNGVNFNSEENDPVKIVLLLAAKDSDQHIELITSIAEFFSSEDDVFDVSVANNKQQLIDVVKKF